MKKNVFLFGFAILFSISIQAQQIPRYKANSLEKLQTITINQGLRSHNGLYNLIMQKDGNLCVYKNGNLSVWCSMTNNQQKNTLIMQNDGNLVIYNQFNRPIWSTNTYNGGIQKTGKMLVLQNDGNLMLFNQYNKAIWTSQRGRLY